MGLLNRKASERKALAEQGKPVEQASTKPLAEDTDPLAGGTSYKDLMAAGSVKPRVRDQLIPDPVEEAKLPAEPKLESADDFIQAVTSPSTETKERNTTVAQEVLETVSVAASEATPLPKPTLADKLKAKKAKLDIDTYMREHYGKAIEETAKAEAAWDEFQSLLPDSDPAKEEPKKETTFPEEKKEYYWEAADGTVWATYHKINTMEGAVREITKEVYDKLLELEARTQEQRRQQEAARRKALEEAKLTPAKTSLTKEEIEAKQAKEEERKQERRNRIHNLLDNVLHEEKDTTQAEYFKKPEPKSEKKPTSLAERLKMRKMEETQKAVTEATIKAKGGTVWLSDIELEKKANIDREAQMQEQLEEQDKSLTEEEIKALPLAERIAYKRKMKAVEQKVNDHASKQEDKPLPVTTTIHEKLTASMETKETKALDTEVAAQSVSLKDRIEQKRRAKEQEALSHAGETPAQPVIVTNGEVAKASEHIDVHAAPANRQAVTLNEEQRLANHMVTEENKTGCLIGAAGTGKTTAVRSICADLLEKGKLSKVDFKKQGGEGMHDRVEGLSIAMVAFTRRAANNLRDSICADEDLKEHFYYSCQTIHNLLEFYPEEYTRIDEETGEETESMRFVPNKGSWDKLDIDYLIIEEGSMVGLDLAEQLMDALEDHVQILYIGDINQLPPVFGASILSYALVKLPVVELVQVYRQALESPIIKNAHNILKGKGLDLSHNDFRAYEEYSKGKGLAFQRVGGTGKPVQAGQHKMSRLWAQAFKLMYKHEQYNPESDIILSPFNKQELGTTNMNNHIAQFLGEDRKAVVHEIIAGFNKVYLAEGDRVMFDKQDGVIESISINGMYMGQMPQPAGKDLNRFGQRVMGSGTKDLNEVDYTDFSIDKMLDEDAGERKRAASHSVKVLLDNGETVYLNTAAEFSEQRFSLGYVLTVHKAQGCEWKRVFFIMHKGHSSMLTRELFYTGVTRAREECVLLTKQAWIDKAIASQRIKGNSTAEKIEYFNSGALANLDIVQVQK